MNTITVTYDIYVSRETLEDIKSRNGCKYWIEENEGEVTHNPETRDIIVTFPDSHALEFCDEALLKGLAQWSQENTRDKLEDVLAGYGDHTEHDEIWQFAFFGEQVYA